MEPIPGYEARLRRMREALRTLPDKPEESPESALHALWCLAAGHRFSVQEAAGHEAPPLDEAQLRELDSLIERRICGEPLAYLLQRQRFMGLELLAGPQALIPRHETEMLGWAALELLRGLAADGSAPCCIDVCCGSGNLALALAHAEPAARVQAADLSGAAVELARANARGLGLESRVELHLGDLLEPFDAAHWQGSVDIIVSAPPYISSARLEGMPHEIIGFEPAMAFDGGAFGVGILMRLLRQAPRLLRAGGWLCVEVGQGQGPAMLQLAQRDPAYDEVRSIVDDQGHPRVLLARRARGDESV